MNKESGFDFQQEKRRSPLPPTQHWTDSEAHPSSASYLVGTGIHFSLGKAART